ncbi:uroporphyrinogen decarboxylase family protein [Desulfosporosinus sp. SB140]|uniref:uroporphyrinogen decarboxylase family protein n=1 Tax=Desulfosporosinus paludis TaxID=3115649 RepID=UPI00388DDF82
MTKSVEELYAERLGRYQAAIALEPVDRMPVASGSNYFSEVYSGNTNQETIYDPEKWLQAEEAFIKDFPEVDVLRNNRVWAPLYDSVNLKTYKLPGRDLPVHGQIQFVENEYMKADEYDLLINNRMEFMMGRYLPRVLGDMAEMGSIRSNMAYLKGGIAQVLTSQVMRNRSIALQTKCGMPQPMTGAFVAPFDALSDCMRGLRSVLIDMYRQPDKVVAACDVLVDEMVNFALSTADPLKRYPIFVPTHKPHFLSPKQFEKFYWPSFKRTMQKLIDAGYSIRAYLEGDWGKHWNHLLELPKGRVLCDIDNQGDIFQAKKDIGHHFCITGGVPDSLLILGAPQEVRERVKMLCETLGKDGGFIVNGGCNIPYDAKPENYRAMVDAIIEFGTYDTSLKMKPKAAPEVVGELPERKVLTPWDIRVEEWGGVQGDVGLIRRPWEMLESMSYAWIWQWVM